jgi:hypothetical protein
MLSKLPADADRNHLPNPRLWMKPGLWTNGGPITEIVSAPWSAQTKIIALEPESAVAYRQQDGASTSNLASSATGRDS